MNKNQRQMNLKSMQMNRAGISVKEYDFRCCFLRVRHLLSQIGMTAVFILLSPLSGKAQLEKRESADSFFIRQGIFQVDTDTGNQILLNKNKIDANAAANLRQLFQFIQKENAAELLDPKKIEVIYDNEFFNRVRSFAINTAYQSTTKIAEIPENVQDYLDFEKSKMQTFLNQRRTQIQYVEFKAAQKSNQFAKGMTLAEENLVIYGLTESVYLKVDQIIAKYIKKYKLQKIGLYVYGSRVMPRAEVIRRNPVRFSHWGIYDDGVSKTSIRTSGITSLSDLDLILTVFEPSGDKSEIFAIGMEIQNDLNQNIKNFPISLWITPSKSSDKELAFKKFVRDRKGFASDFQIIDSKTLAMPKTCAWLLM